MATEVAVAVVCGGGEEGMRGKKWWRMCWCAGWVAGWLDEVMVGWQGRVVFNHLGSSTSPVTSGSGPYGTSRSFAE